jgi:hypothetical protein
MVHKFGASATILDILNLIRSRAAMKFLHVSAALAVSLCSVLPLPAKAGGVTTAAWVTARAVCRALSAGLTIPDSVRVGITDNAHLWAAEMRDPVFQQLLVAEVIQQCPYQLMLQAPATAPEWGAQL